MKSQFWVVTFQTGGINRNVLISQIMSGGQADTDVAYSNCILVRSCLWCLYSQVVGYRSFGIICGDVSNRTNGSVSPQSRKENSLRLNLYFCLIDISWVSRGGSGGNLHLFVTFTLEWRKYYISVTGFFIFENYAIVYLEKGKFLTQDNGNESSRRSCLALGIILPAGKQTLVS